MVFFNCNACGESLKKNQVEKHYMTKCRRCEVLSCVDCGKEFWGNDYQEHTKCISEEEKYSGKNFVPKVNKGEVKQERWLEQVQAAIEKTKTVPRLKSLLESLKDYPNIPRKRHKFQNFLSNSLRIRDMYLINQVWDLLMAESKENDKPVAESKGSNQSDNNKTAQKSDSVTERSEQSGKDSETLNGDARDENTEKEGKKLSKRERKEERRKKLHKKEKKEKHDEQVENSENGEAECHKRGSKKKRKHSECEDGQKKKGKKRKRMEIEEEPEAPVDTSCVSDCNEENDEADEEPPTKKNVKFNWEEVITSVLTSKGEMSLKKLKKKVLCEFAAQGSFAKSEEKLWAKFNKKVSKNPNFKVLKDRVKLVG